MIRLLAFTHCTHTLTKRWCCSDCLFVFSSPSLSSFCSSAFLSNAIINVHIVGRIHPFVSPCVLRSCVCVRASERVFLCCLVRIMCVWNGQKKSGKKERRKRHQIMIRINGISSTVFLSLSPLRLFVFLLPRFALCFVFSLSLSFRFVFIFEKRPFA